MGRYISKFIINESDPIYSQVGNINSEFSDLTAKSAYASNVRIKDSTGINQGITIGGCASNALYFDITNPNLDSYLGAVVEMWIKGDDTGNLPGGNATDDGGNVTIADIPAIIDSTTYEEIGYESYGDTMVELDFDNDNIPEEDTPSPEPADFPDYEAYEDWTDEGTDDTFDVTVEETTTDADESEFDFSDNPNVSEYEDTDVEEETEVATGWTKIGVFNVQESNYNSDKTVVSLVCYDNMALLTGMFEPFERIGSVEHYQVILDQALMQDYGFGFTTELEVPTEVIRWIDFTTYRDSVGYIAGLCGGYATCDEDGNIVIKGYENTGVEIHSTSFKGSGLSTSTDGETIITGIACDVDISEEEDILSAGDAGADLIIENPLMTQEILDKYVFPKFVNLEYNIGKLQCEWENALRAGTLVRIYNSEDDALRNSLISALDTAEDPEPIETAIDNIGRNFFITNQTIDLDGGVTTIDSLGLTPLQQSTQTNTSDYRKMQRINIQSKEAQEIARTASTVAQANNQHFWTQETISYVLSADTEVLSGKTYYVKYDDNYVEVIPVGDEDPSDLGWYEALGAGAYITEKPQEDVIDETGQVTEQGFKSNPTGANSLWNSLGMLFRNGLTNLLAIITGNTTGVAIYDGQGNSDENIIASFTDKGSVIGSQDNSRTIIGNEEVTMVNKDNVETFSIRSSGTNYVQPVTETIWEWIYRNQTRSYTMFKRATPSTGVSFNVLCSVSEFTLSPLFVYGTADTITETVTVGNSTYTAIFTYDGEDGLTVNYTITGSSIRSLFIDKTSFEISADAPSFTMGSRTVGEDVGAFSFTVGNDLIAPSQNQVVIGQYNDISYNYDPDDIFIIGDGDLSFGRHNVLRVRRATDQKNALLAFMGDMWVEGKLEGSENLWGSQSADYVMSGRFGNLRVLTGNETVNVSSANTNTDVSVSYGVTFKYNPNVQLTMLNIGGSYYQKVTCASPSTTGFTIRVRAGNAPGNVNVNWVAIGELA